jgi:hypothetical protein
MVWLANLSFLIHGKLLPTYFADELKTCQTWLVTRLYSGEESISKHIGYLKLIHPQIRSTWVPADSFCSVPYVRTNNKTIVSMFITDFILLVTMLVGLFRLRRIGAGRFGVGHLLWKQVSWSRSFICAVISFH